MAKAFARPYHEVAHRLLEWQSEGYVEIDHSPALYLHEYTVTGMTIRGVVGTLDLSTRAKDEAHRAVFAHEGIHPAQADELAERMHEMGVNPAPILLVHHGSALVRQTLDSVSSRTPEHDYVDRAGQHHRLWRISAPAELAVITAGMAATRLMIADGHHRYAAYVRLQDDHPRTPWDRGLVMVVDQDDTPFFLGAIHRSFPGLPAQPLVDAARAAGAQVQETTEERAIDALGSGTWVVTDRSAWWTINRPEALSPVEDLHQNVLPLLAGQAQPQYHHTVDDTLKHAGTTHCAVLLPAPAYDLLDRAMAQGTLLPEKATSFQPKPNIGVLMRSVDSELLSPLY